MNIFKKLSKARVELQNMELKMSGENKYSNYKYYELRDILPAINALGEKHGFITQFYISKNEGVEEATLRVIDSESETIEGLNFTCPTAEVEIGKKRDGTGGAEPIQNLGGKITYMRRYMLMTAFEIIESDEVEKINIDLKDSVEEKDEAKIRDCKNQKELSSVCNVLMKKYKKSLITPIYEEMRTKFIQNESEA